MGALGRQNRASHFRAAREDRDGLPHVIGLLKMPGCTCVRRDNQGGTVEFPPLTLSGAVFCLEKECDMRTARRIIGAALALILVLALTGCSGKPLPEDMDEETLLDAGREIVTLLNEGDYQGVYDRMRADGQEASTVDDVREAMENLLDEVGPYVKENDTLATGQTLDSGEEYGTAVFYCKHEKKNVVYRVAFSTEMELMGFTVGKQSLFG